MHTGPDPNLTSGYLERNKEAIFRRKSRVSALCMQVSTHFSQPFTTQKTFCAVLLCTVCTVRERVRMPLSYYVATRRHDASRTFRLLCSISQIDCVRARKGRVRVFTVAIFSVTMENKPEAVGPGRAASTSRY